MELDGDAALQAALGDVWMTFAGDDYHVHHTGNVHTMFRARYRSILTDIRTAAIDASQPLSRLVEIGCGTGRLLDDCRVACPEIASFVDLDLNPYAIAIDRSAADPAANLHIEQAEAVSRLEAHSVSGTVLVSYNGVLEHLSRGAVSQRRTGLPGFRRQPSFFANRSLTITISMRIPGPIRSGPTSPFHTTTRPS